MHCQVSEDHSSFDVTDYIKQVEFPAEVFEEKEGIHCNKYVEMSAIYRKQGKQISCSSQVSTSKFQAFNVYLIQIIIISLIIIT